MKYKISRLKLPLIILLVLTLIRFIPTFSRLAKEITKNKSPYITIISDDFTYEIESDWKQGSSANKMGFVYSDPDSEDMVFMCSLIASGNNLTPDQYFQELKASMPDESTEVYEPVSDVKTDSNGVEYQTGCIKYNQGNKKLFSYMVFCEEKNMVVLFQAKCEKEKNVEDTFKSLKRMANSIVFKTLPDAVTGKVFEVSSEAGAVTHYIVSYDDKTFKMCEKLENSYTDYVGGKYQVFRGKKALEKVASMEEYGLTEEELKNIFTNQDISPERQYAVVFTIDKDVSDGKAESVDKVTKLYLATADEKGTNLDVFSCNDIKYEKWKLLA